MKFSAALIVAALAVTVANAYETKNLRVADNEEDEYNVEDETPGHKTNIDVKDKDDLIVDLSDALGDSKGGSQSYDKINLLDLIGHGSGKVELEDLLKAFDIDTKSHAGSKDDPKDFTTGFVADETVDSKVGGKKGTNAYNVDSDDINETIDGKGGMEGVNGKTNGGSDEDETVTNKSVNTKIDEDSEEDETVTNKSVNTKIDEDSEEDETVTNKSVNTKIDEDNEDLNDGADVETDKVNVKESLGTTATNQPSYGGDSDLPTSIGANDPSKAQPSSTDSYDMDSVFKKIRAGGDYDSGSGKSTGAPPPSSLLDNDNGYVEKSRTYPTGSKKWMSSDAEHPAVTTGDDEEDPTLVKKNKSDVTTGDDEEDPTLVKKTKSDVTTGDDEEDPTLVKKNKSDVDTYDSTEDAYQSEVVNEKTASKTASKTGKEPLY